LGRTARRVDHRCEIDTTDPNIPIRGGSAPPSLAALFTKKAASHQSIQIAKEPITDTSLRRGTNPHYCRDQYCTQDIFYGY
jgi:hypothetical protein